MSAEIKYDLTVYPMTVAVRSASDGAKVRLVQLPYCDCPDFTNRKGLLSDDGTVTVCKHIREALERVGGWHRGPQTVPVPEAVTYYRLARPRAVTLLTSAFLASDLVDRLLRGAVGASPMAVTVRVTDGDVLVKYDGQSRAYTVTLPGSQPVALPATWPAELRGQRA
jgi:hypothetical protein